MCVYPGILSGKDTGGEVHQGAREALRSTGEHEHATEGTDNSARLLTMMLVIATKAKMNAMYVFVRLKVSLTENVFIASPPPRIATSSRPFKTHTKKSAALHAPTKERDATYIRQHPEKEDVRAHVRVVVPRELLLLHVAQPRRLRQRSAVAEVVEGLLIDVVHVRRVRWHLEVDLRVAVLDDGSEVRVDLRVLFRAP